MDPRAHPRKREKGEGEGVRGSVCLSAWELPGGVCVCPRVEGVVGGSGCVPGPLDLCLSASVSINLSG